MLNLYTKKSQPTQYNEQDVVEVIEGKCINTLSKCNFCGDKIYWNTNVVHKGTKKKLPLSKPFYGRGTTPLAHRGCKYNTENFYDQLVIHEDDSAYVKATKLNQQKKLQGADESGLTSVERLILGRTPEEIQSYNEFIKHATDHTFNPAQKSGMDPSKMLKGMRIKK